MYQYSCHDPACLLACLRGLVWWSWPKTDPPTRSEPDPSLCCSNAVDWGGRFRFPNQKGRGGGRVEALLFIFGRYVTGSRFADSSRIVQRTKVGRGWQSTSPVRPVSRSEEAPWAAPSHGALWTSLPGEECQWIIQAHAAYDQGCPGMCVAASGDNKSPPPKKRKKNGLPQLPCWTCQIWENGALESWSGVALLAAALILGKCVYLLQSEVCPTDGSLCRRLLQRCNHGRHWIDAVLLVALWLEVLWVFSAGCSSLAFTQRCICTALDILM